MVDNGDGTYDVFFTPTVAGDSLLSVTLHGTHISGSRFALTVVPGEADPARCTLRVLERGETYYLLSA